MKRFAGMAHYSIEGDRRMDHDEAVRTKVTERYLLNELDPELRDQFEEHLFDCQDCALDVRAAAFMSPRVPGRYIGLSLRHNQAER